MDSLRYSSISFRKWIEKVVVRGIGVVTYSKEDVHVDVLLTAKVPTMCQKMQTQVIASMGKE